MNLPKIEFLTDRVVYANNYFKAFSWRGRTISVLGATTCLLFIYWLFTRKKEPTCSSSLDHQALNGNHRVVDAPPPAAPQDLPKTILPDAPAAKPAPVSASPAAAKEPEHTISPSGAPKPVAVSVPIPDAPQDLPKTIPPDAPAAKLAPASPSPVTAKEPPHISPPDAPKPAAVSLPISVTPKDPDKANSSEPDFLNDLFMEFKVVIADLADKCPKWNEDIQTDLQKTRFIGALRRSVNEVNKATENLVKKLEKDERLKGYPIEGWQECLKNCKTLMENLKGINADGKTLHQDFQTLLEGLQILDQKRQEVLKAALMRKLEELPHYEFPNIEVYLSYLDLVPYEDSERLGIQRRDLYAVGVVTMEDIKVLQLLDCQLLIENLRQLCCCLQFKFQAEEDSSELSRRFKEKILGFIEKVCMPKTGYAEEENLMKNMRNTLIEITGEPLTERTIGKFFSDLDILEQEDKKRQMVWFKAYVSQIDNIRAWKDKIYPKGSYSLSQFCEKNKDCDPYSIGMSQ